MCICVYTHVLVQLKAPSKSKQTKPNNNKKSPQHFAIEKAKNAGSWRRARGESKTFFTVNSGHFVRRMSSREGFGFANRHRNVCQLIMNLLFAFLSA